MELELKLKRKIPYGGKLLAGAIHPQVDKQFLILVLVDCEGQFITWNLNLQDGGYHLGHYFLHTNPEEKEAKRLEAYRDFMNRLGLMSEAGR